MSITDNAPGSPQKVSLTGTGTVVKLNPTTLNFGSEGLGGSKALTTTLTNVGSTTLSITSITITGSSEFSETNTCGTGVGAGKSCSITATFKPTVSGTGSGDVSISDNGGASPQQVPLSGTGVVCGGVCPTHGCPTGCRCAGLNPPFCVPNFLTNELLLDPNSAASAPCGK